MNKIIKGGPLKRLVLGDTKGLDGLRVLEHADAVSVARVGRLHLAKTERDATGASFGLIDAESGYSLRQVTKAQGLRFLREHDPEKLVIFITGMLAGMGARPEGFQAAAEEVLGLLQTCCR